MTRTREQLPERLRVHLERNLPDPPAQAVGTLLHQSGRMRLDPKRDWVPFTAEQLIDAGEVGFVWHARVRMAPLVTAVVEDAFEAGKGRLDAKIWGLIPVAHGRGPDIDRGEAERYLAELPWCPLALLRNPDLRFRANEDGSVRVEVFDAETFVDLSFDEAGDIVGSRSTTRSRGDVVQPWVGSFADYRDFGGVRAPSRGRVWWETPEGPFVYWEGEITELGFRTG